MKALFIISIFIVSLSACSKKISTTTSSVKDSTSVIEKIKYVPILIPGEKVQLPGVVIKCDSITNKPIPVKVKGKNGRANAAAEINQDGVLNVEASCDSMQKLIGVMDREIFRLKHEKKDTVIIKEPSKFKIWIDYSAYAISILVFLYIAFKIVKRIYFPTS